MANTADTIQYAFKPRTTRNFYVGADISKRDAAFPDYTVNYMIQLTPVEGKPFATAQIRELNKFLKDEIEGKALELSDILEKVYDKVKELSGAEEIYVEVRANNDSVGLVIISKGYITKAIDLTQE